MIRVCIIVNHEISHIKVGYVKWVIVVCKMCLKLFSFYRGLIVIHKMLWRMAITCPMPFYATFVITYYETDNKIGTQINNRTNGHKVFKWFGNLPTSTAEVSSIIIREWEIQTLISLCSSLFSLFCVCLLSILCRKCSNL